MKVIQRETFTYTVFIAKHIHLANIKNTEVRESSSAPHRSPTIDRLHKDCHK